MTSELQTEIRNAAELMKADPKAMDKGKPRVDVVRKLVGNPDITAEDVDEALKPAPEPVVEQAPVDLSKVPANPESVDRMDGKRILEAAVAAEMRLQKDIETAQNDRAATDRRIDSLIAEKDRATIIKQRYTRVVSFAEGVKAIQQQTVQRLQQVKDATAVAARALQATGTVVHASALDAALANRKRNPEQQANYAKFVHQNSAAARRASAEAI